MASMYSTNLKIELITTGEQAGIWGTTTNTNLGTALEQAIVGKADIDMNSTTITLTLTNTNAAQDARAFYLNLTGTPGGAATLEVPAIEKPYIVRNGSNQVVTVKVTGQTGVAVPVGATMWLYNNGTDVTNAITNLPSGATVGGVAIGTGSGTVTSVSGTGTVNGISLSGTVTSSGNITLGGTLSNVDLTSQVTGTLPVANGGTGITSFGTGVATALGNAVNTTSGYVTQGSTLDANNVLLGGGSGTAISSSNLLSTSAAVTSGTYIKAIGYADTVVSLGNTSTAINLDVVSGGVFTATLTGNATITLRYPVSSGASSFTLILTNDGTAGRTVAWAGGTFLFPGGASSLSRTTTANAVDIWVFFTPDGGTTYYGNIAMKDVKA